MTNAISYQVSDSGKTAPTGTWVAEVPDVPAGQYLWTKTAVTYSDGTTTISYSVSRSGSNGKDGQGVTVSSTKTTYQQSTDGQKEPTGTWSDKIPTISYSVSRSGSNGKDGQGVTVSSTKTTYQQSTDGQKEPTGTWSDKIPTLIAGSYLWTKTTVTYSDGKTSVSTSVSRNGADGKDGKNGTNGKDGQDAISLIITSSNGLIFKNTAISTTLSAHVYKGPTEITGSALTNGKDGQDAISLIITSSNGLIFKNTAISTTLSAHVYKGPTEITGSALSALGTLNWYKDDSSKPVGTGASLVIDVGDVKDRATYVCQLED